MRTASHPDRTQCPTNGCENRDHTYTPTKDEELEERLSALSTWSGGVVVQLGLIETKNRVSVAVDWPDGWYPFSELRAAGREDRAPVPQPFPWGP